MTTDERTHDGMTPDDDRPMDGLDRLIATAARDYHTPPAATPRDAMWAAIVAARIPAAPDAAPAVVRPIESARSAQGATPRNGVRRTPARSWWGLAAAAAIFLATGVGIGRWWGRTSDQAAAPNGAAGRLAAVDRAAPSLDTTAGEAPVPDAAVPNAVAPDITVPDARRSATVTTVASATSAATGRGGRTFPRSGTRLDLAPADDPYDVALVNHFAQAEALLVSYRADTLDAALDARLSQWARPLLGDTRLLLDSPAAADPRRRRLLEDLELVLAQLARLAPAARDTVTPDPSTRSGPAGRAERRLIDGAMRHAQLLPRLRTVVPAGTDI